MQLAILLFRLTTQCSTVHGFDVMFGSLDTAPGYREHATPSTQKQELPWPVWIGMTETGVAYEWRGVNF